MPYYTGSAGSFAEIRAALINACVAEGWSHPDSSTLTKGEAVVRLTISTTDTPALGPGIHLQGATGLDSGSLVNPSLTQPRFGRPHRVIGAETWPMTYFIHIFDEPDEVYLVANFNVDSYWWLAFGVSDNSAIPGTGLWLAAISRMGQGFSGTNVGGGISISPSSGGTSASSNVSAGAFFWQTTRGSTGSTNNDTIHAGLNGTQWAGDSVGLVTEGFFNGLLPASNLLERMPSTWNAEAILLPIQGMVWQAERKASPVVDVRNARYTRVDNYTPGQIITLGDDRWRIYPFYKKNSAERDGGNSRDHTGTLGWAIRYDGP